MIEGVDVESAKSGASARASTDDHSFAQFAPWAIPAAIVVVWVGFVTVGDHWSRVTDNWQSALTMTGGGFIAGSTPLGGGAVAFPVFTKALDISAPVARTFGLSIQAVGMGTAALIILLRRYRVDGRAVLVGSAAGVAGFVGALALLAERDTVFWSPTIAAPYVKVTFTVCVAALAYSLYLSSRPGRPDSTMIEWRTRTWIGVVGFSLLGGVASALTGTGVNVFLFMFLVIVAGMSSRVGVPTSIVVMAIISIVGLVILGVVDGQLSTTVVADEVVAVGGSPIDPLPARQFDLFGLWIAAIPIVVWAAPLGASFAHALTERRLAGFVVVMAMVEVVTTVILLDDLRRDRRLAGYSLVALTLVLVGVAALCRHRDRLLAEAASAG